MDTDEHMISQKVVPTFEGASAIVADKIQQVEIYILLILFGICFVLLRYIFFSRIGIVKYLFK